MTTRTPIRHDLTAIWEGPTVEEAQRAVDDALRAYDAHPTIDTNAALHDAFANLSYAEEHAEERSTR